MLQENFNVTWHNYTDHLREMLEEMHFDDSFADVTLVTDDKRQLKAHKNILSACSSVFKEILHINTNDNHPVIYLRGIQHSEMKSILKFIYSGESNFHEERMDEFLLVAKNLGIKELGNNAEVGDSVVSAENYDNVSTGNVSDDKVVFDDIPSSQEALPHEYSQEEQIITSPIIPLVEPSVSPEGSSQGEENLSDNVRKRRHEGVRYDCDHCDKQFKRQDRLHHHIKSAHEGVKYVCNQCGHKATRQSDLKNHIKTIHEGIKYDCNECDKQYTDQSTLRKHILSSHKGVKYACNQCSYEAKLQKQVKTHIQSVHEGIKYACNQCDHQSTSQSGLIKHIQCIHEGLKYDCNQCDRQFSHHGDLKFHIKSEHEGVRYACPHCNKQFKRPVSLHNHILSSSCKIYQ